MLKQSQIDALTYFETHSAKAFTSKPQGAVDVDRMVKGQTDCWPKLAPAGKMKKKDLILADWWAENWDELTLSQVRVLLSELMEAGFKLYVWLDPDLRSLDDITLLDTQDFRKKIKPEFKDVLITQAMNQHQLPCNKLAIIQRTELEDLLGRTVEETQIIDASYLLETSHPIEKIKAVEAIAPSSFKKALLYQHPWQSKQGIIKQLKLNWPNIEPIENYRAFHFDVTSKIYLDEQGHVSVKDHHDTYRLSNNLSSFCLGRSVTDSSHLASEYVQFLTPALKNLVIEQYPVGDHAFDTRLGNLTHLDRLNLGQECPAEIELKIIHSSQLKCLEIDMGRHKLRDEMNVSNMAGSTDQSLSQLRRLCLSGCDSRTLEYMLHREMPELIALTLVKACLDRPFRSKHPLNKLMLLSIRGECLASGLESLMRSAVYCARLDLRGAKIKGEMSPRFHLPQIKSLYLDSDLDETKEPSAATPCIVRAASALTNLTLSGDLCTFSFMDTIPLPQLQSLSLYSGRHCLSAETLSPLLKGRADLTTLDLHVGYADHSLSANDLKKMLVGLPKLRSLTFDVFRVDASWSSDTELQRLFSHIEQVTLSSACEMGFSHAPSLYAGRDEGAALSRTRNPEQSKSVDHDTTPNPNKVFDLPRIFYAASDHPHPKPSRYRLSTYNQLILSHQSGSNRPFILKNTGDLDLVPCKLLIEVRDVFKLDSDSRQGGYFGRQTFHLDSTWQPIASLSAADHISHLSGGSDHEMMYSNRDDLYYIRNQTGLAPQTITLDFLVKPAIELSREALSPEIQVWVDMFMAFGQGTLQLNDANPSAQAYLDAMVDQKVGACRHRTVAFTALMAKTLPQLPVRIVENDCHSFVEIKQYGQWVQCDLGGYPATLEIKEFTLKQDQARTKPDIYSIEMCPISEQQRRFEQYFETWSMERDPRAAHLSRYLDGLLNGQHKKQLILIPTDALNALNIVIQTQAIYTGHPIFYIHSPDDLVCSAPSIKRDQTNQGTLCSARRGGGPLHDFLTAPRENSVHSPILLVNYARFSADDVVRFNTLLDEIRYADGTPVPPNAIVMGLMDPDKPGAYNGSDFYSRFDLVEQCPLTTIPPMLPVLSALTRPHESLSEPIQINLCHASNWLTQLMGGWTLNHGALYFEEGPLPSALTSGHSIEILNPPVDSAFDLFWQQARLHESIQYAGVSYPFPKEVQCYRREGYDWAGFLDRIIWSEPTSAHARVLNPSLLGDFLGQYQFDQDGLFTRVPGLLAEQATNHPDAVMPIIVTRSLSTDEWGIFINEAQQYKTLTFDISCSPGVTLPEALEHPLPTPVVPSPSWNKTLDPQTTCIVSDDPDLTIAGITQSHADRLVFNVSECTDSDLIQRISGKWQDLALVFTETEQGVLTALKQGRQVILTGHFSDELLDGLASFIRQRVSTPDAPGQLILVSQKPFGFIDTVSHRVTVDEKRNALLAQGFTGDEMERLEQEIPACMVCQSFTILSTRLHYLRVHPEQTSLHAWDGFSALRPSMSLNAFNPATSERDAQTFLDTRLMAFHQAIQHQPYVFLAGLTGVGKSCFVEHELTDRKVFHGEASIRAWIMARPDMRPTLFLDEANLSTRQWSEMEGLFNQPPGILLDGTYYPLSAQHKVVFAGNPLSYGDERQLAPLFARHGNSMVFQPLSNAFIYEKTLKPLLKEHLDPNEIEFVSKELLRVYDFLVGASRDDVLISPRQIQMMALAVIDYHARFPQADITQIAAFHARHFAHDRVPKSHIEPFNQAFPPVDRRTLLNAYEHKKPTFKRFLATPSRDAAWWQLTDFLSLRAFQRETAMDNPTLRLGGLHRFVIEGEPGIGKSEMVIERMAGEGIHEAHLSDTPKPGLKTNHFYRVSASMQPGMQEAILFKAFDDGAIVLMDEINSMPTLEKRLNSLLDGKHPEENHRPPLNPGFRVLGTQNPPTMAGRRIASRALDNRTQTVRLTPYPAEEMHAILDNMGISSRVTRTELIDAFQSKANEAKIRHLTPAPSFRHFMTVAKQHLDALANVQSVRVKHQTLSIGMRTNEYLLTNPTHDEYKQQFSEIRASHEEASPRSIEWGGRSTPS